MLRDEADGAGGNGGVAGSGPAMSGAAREETLMLRLDQLTWLAPDVRLFAFRSPDGAPLPAFEPGAHVDIHLPGGLVRQYSLAFVSDRDAYRVAVKLERGGRGGSRLLFEAAQVGDLFRIGGPRNHFPLALAAGPSVLIAGGIGITPIRCMAERLAADGRSFALHYAVSARPHAAFLGDLHRLSPVMELHVDAERGGVLDIRAIVAAAPAGSHFYCCGPAPMLAAFEAATAELPSAQVHLEYFSAPELAPAEGGFTIVLARSGRELFVPENATILDTLRAAGIAATASCQQGVCGACETRVLEGVPDHRDLLLTPEEKAANDTMMICCSGALTSRLVLDI